MRSMRLFSVALFLGAVATSMSLVGVATAQTITVTFTPTATPVNTATATTVPFTGTPTATATITATQTPTPFPVPYGVCAKVVNAPPTPGTTGTPARPVAVAVADFNHDSLADIAVADQQYGRIVVFLARAVSTPTPGASSDNTPGPEAACQKAGVEYSPDVVLSVSDPGALTTQVLEADGTSADLDLNLDGNIDLAVVGSDGLTVFLGDGTGRFSAASLYPLATNSVAAFAPGSIAAAQFNADRWPDIIVADGGTNVSLFLNQGDGVLCSACPINVGLSAGLVVAGDFDDSGTLDLAVAAAHDLKFALQSSQLPVPSTGQCDCSTVQGSFNMVGTQHSNAAITAIQAGTFGTSDVVPDLAFITSFQLAGMPTPTASLPDGNLVLYLNSRPTPAGPIIRELQAPVAVPRPTVVPALPSAPSALGLVNREGRNDLVVAEQNNDDVAIFRERADASFLFEQLLSLNGQMTQPAQPVGMTVGNLDNDIVPDIVTANAGNGSISIFLSEARPPTATAPPTPTPPPTATATQTPVLTATFTMTASPIGTLKPGTLSLQGSCALNSARSGDGESPTVMGCAIALALAIARYRARKRN